MRSVLHLNDRLVGVKLRSLGDVNRPVLRFDVFTKHPISSSARDTIKENLNDLLGVNDDLAQFYELARNDLILKHAIDDLYGMHDTYSSSLFARATLAILLQMTNIKRSNQMMNSVITQYGQSPEFDGRQIKTWPTYERLKKLTPNQLAKT
jgi:DNA-3-methyladenine glycosylase II